MKVINLTVLAVDGPATKAYLEYLRFNGISPYKIIDVRFKTKLKTKSGKFFYIQKLFGKRFAYSVLNLYKRLFYKEVPYGYKFNYNNYIQLGRLILENSKITPNYFSKIDYSEYSQITDSIIVPDINSINLAKLLEAEKVCRTYLFTGGGILKDTILNIPNSRFIHVHPGIVPLVKGSDGIFWSLVNRGKIGMSAFFMNTGIDTGDIIYTKEYDTDLSKLNINIEDYGLYTIYRAILDFYDPLFRAETLILMLKENRFNLDIITVTIQNPSDGRYFFGMHPRVRELGIRMMLGGYRNV